MFENISTVYIIESASQHLHFFFNHHSSVICKRAFCGTKDGKKDLLLNTQKDWKYIQPATTRRSFPPKIALSKTFDTWPLFEVLHFRDPGEKCVHEIFLLEQSFLSQGNPKCRWHKRSKRIYKRARETKKKGCNLACDIILRLGFELQIFPIHVTKNGSGIKDYYHWLPAKSLCNNRSRELRDWG